METFITKFNTYLNVDLKNFYLHKGISIIDNIDVYYINNQIIMEGTEYLNIIKKDEKILNNISDIINKNITNIFGTSDIVLSSPLIFNIKQKLSNSIIKEPIINNSNIVVPKMVTTILLDKFKNTINYLDILPEDLIYIIIENSIYNGDLYYNFLKMSKINPIFDKILKSQNYYQKLFYNIADYYSHINTLPDNVDNWKDLFRVTYINRFPRKIKDFEMTIRKKIIFKPIYGEHLKFYGRTFYIITDLKLDNKGLPMSFKLGFEDSYNYSRTKLYWDYRNYDRFISTSYERKATKWSAPGSNNYFEQNIDLLKSVIISSSKVLLYLKDYDKLIIPYIGLEFIVDTNFFNYLYKVIDFEYKDNLYSKIYTEYIGSNKDVKHKRLTLVPNDDKTAYIAIEDKNITDMIKNYTTNITWYPPFELKEVSITPT